MRKLIVRNFGPLKEVKADLGRFNLIIGKQSSGKSSVLKIACYCAWVEKSIQLAQSPEYFMSGNTFINDMILYHKFHGYMKPMTYIEYVTDYMSFSYDNQKQIFEFKWKKNRMKYMRPKISYIPSERNIVSFIPDWKYQVSAYDCVLDFMRDWDMARKYIGKTSNILNLGMRYQFEEITKEDNVYLLNGKSIALTNSSSGVQSIVPLYVCLEYITRYIYNAEIEAAKKRTERDREKYVNLLMGLYRQSKQVYNELDAKYPESPVVYSIDNEDFIFRSKDTVNLFANYINHYSFTQCTDVYLEEPENNLFPPTQCQLADLLIELSKRRKKTVSLFVTTHSPYILTHLLQQNVPGFRLFFTHFVDAEQEYIVQQATETEVQEIYDNGLDMFFNYEAFVK